MSFLSGLVGDVTGGNVKPVASNPNIQNFQNNGLFNQAQNGVAGQLGNQTSLQNALQGQSTSQTDLQNALQRQLSGQVGNQEALQSALSPQVAAQAGLQSQLAGQNGIGNQASVFSQQQALANQLAQQAQGGGPNPAQALLSNQTGQNAANQAALMASQRGASANPALLARQAAQQGAATQQQAVGQAAALQAQQQLQAEQQLQGQQQALGNLATTQTGQQIQNQQSLANQALNNQQALSNAQLSQGQNLYNTGLSAALTNTQNLAGNQLANQNSILQGIGQQNATQAGITNAQQQGQNALSAQTQKQTGDLVGSLFNTFGNLAGFGAKAGAAAAPAALALAQGGEVSNPKLSRVPEKDRFPSHALMPSHLKEMATLYHGHSFGNPKYQPQMKLAHGGNVGSQLKEGGKVPGQAKVSGDSLKNDTVSAKLSPGEVVIPRSVMQSKDPVSAAAQFVAQLQKKKGSAQPESDFKSALKRAIAGRKSA